MVLIVAALFLTTAVPAFAARGHSFDGDTFGTPCLTEPCAAGTFKEPSGVAVNEATGAVYVLDQGDDRVEWFNLNTTTKLYEFEGQFDGGAEFELKGKKEPTTVAGFGKLTGERETGAFSFEHGSINAQSSGIAVDNSCARHPTEPCGDPSNGDVYVVDAGHSVVDKFGPSGEYVGQTTESGRGLFEVLGGVAVDSVGQLWIRENAPNDGVFDFNDAVHNEPPASGGFHETEVGGSFPGLGLAVDGGDDLYVRTNTLSTGVISEFGSRREVVQGELLNPAVDPELPSGVATERSSNDVYIDNVGTVARFDEHGAELERFSVPGGHGAGVAISSVGETVFVDRSEPGDVAVFGPEAPRAPTVESESFSDVTSTGATFEAEINPRSLPGEQGTVYAFEYGPCATASTCATSPYDQTIPEPEGAVGSDFEVHAVSQPVAGLAPGTTYHFRLLTHNSHGTAEAGEEETFTTQTGGAFTLPDGRQWEMVSPPQKRGALIEPIAADGLTQASADGGAITYHANQPIEAEPPGAINQVQALSTRGSEGWSSRDIELRHESVTGKPEGEGEIYRFFNEDLSQAILQPAGSFDPGLSPEASEQTAFLRTDFFNHNPGELCIPSPSASCYRPLVTDKQGFANVPPGTTFGTHAGLGGNGPCPELGVFCGPLFVGASPDAAHVVLESPFQLTPTVTPPNQEELYMWSAGHLALVSALPEAGGPATGIVTLGLGASVDSQDARHAVSDDGTRVFWGVTAGIRHLYMTDLLRGASLQLDKVRGGSGGGGIAPVFQQAASDGSRVFFTDTQQLTVHSGEGRPDLYECQIVTEPSGSLKCELNDLTPETPAGESADVQGSIIGTSQDGCDATSHEGCYVYFVANGVLSAPGTAAAKGDCGGPSGAVCNLYVRHDGTTSLVAVLSGGDKPDWAKEESQLNFLTARVSPNGRWLAFMSDRSLTGFDNRDAVSGHPDEEVYLYDAETAKLECASCNPTGARPIGQAYERNGLEDLPLVGGVDVWPSSWLAANVPGWTPFKAGQARYQSRYLSNTGRLFFNARDALVPRDGNGGWDVYEFEPEGVGGEATRCAASIDDGSEVFRPARAAMVGARKVEEGPGCVALISSGSSPEESAFLDASESGGDVFFLTAEKLARQDFDNAFDIYDAHECTGASPCIAPPAQAPPPCTTAESCRVAPEPEPTIFGASGSATFNGLGNVTPAPGAKRVPETPAQLRAAKLAGALKACGKRYSHSKKRRTACEKRAHRRYPAKSSKRRK